jgi:hypothetical protein
MLKKAIQQGRREARTRVVRFFWYVEGFDRPRTPLEAFFSIRLYAPHVGGPDMLMNLQLKTNRKTIRQDPFSQLTRIEHPEHRAEEDGASIRQCVARHNRF